MGETRADREWYTAPALLNEERSRVFASGWVLVCSSEDLVSPGDFVSTEVAGEPVVVVRDGAGTVRAFHNLCPHRGLLLLEGCGRVEERIRCPYHDWSFGLDGSLERVPQRSTQFPGMDPSLWGLLGVGVTEWCGLVLVNVSGEARPLAEQAAGLIELIEPLFAGRTVLLATERHEVRCNWKLLIENHIDFYHLWYLHRDSLGAYRHADVRRVQLGDHFYSLAPLIDTAAAPRELWWADPETQEGIGAHLLFPNLGIVTTGSYIVTYDAMPLAPDRSEFTVRLRGLEGSEPDGYLKELYAFLDQDMAVCERMQRALASSRWALGPLAVGHEQPVVEFQANVARRLRDDA